MPRSVAEAHAAAVERVGPHLRAMVLVEGDSDRAAVEVAAGRLGRSLVAEGVAVVALHGATNVGHALRLVADGPPVALAGLFDEAEADAVREVLRGAGFTDDAVAVCRPDLEGEFLAALGSDAVERVIRREGEGRQLDTFRRQPFQRERPESERLRRFLGTTSGRKIRYGALLAEAVPLERMPPPLLEVLDSVRPDGRAEQPRHVL